MRSMYTRLPVVLLAALVFGVSCLAKVEGSLAGAKQLASPKTAANFGAGWTTYHRDNARTGYDSTTAAITITNPTKTWNTALDGMVYAEPLIWNGMVIAVTQNDSIYALDEGTGAILWHRVVGASVPTHYCSSEVNPVGIFSTPVIDSTTNIVYAVGLVGPLATPKYQMFALNLADGSPVAGFPVDITPTAVGGTVTLDPTVNAQRGALGLANGHVYVPFGGWLGDCGNYHPWVVSVPTAGGAVDHVYEPQTASQRAAGIWAPSGMSIDGTGNIYVATGNGGVGGFSPCNNGTWDHGNAVIKLSPALAELSFFAPSNWCDLSRTDTDVGSIAPALLAGGIVGQLGKSGELWLLDSANLGGFGGQLNSTTSIGSCSVADAIFGGTAYVYPDLYFACNSANSLQALTVNTGTPSRGFATHWTAGGFRPGPPIAEGGLIWTLDIGGTALYGYDMAGNRKVSVNMSSGVRHFATPAADGNWIFVPQNTSVSGISFASAGPPPPIDPMCGSRACQMYTADAFGGIDPVNADATFANQPRFGFPAARAGHFAPSGTPGVTPPQAGLVLDLYGGLHPYGSPALNVTQAPYYPNFDIARDFVFLPSGSGGYELDGWGGIHPFSIGSNPLPPQPGQYPYFPGNDVAKKITILANGTGGYVLDAFGGIHPWSVGSNPLPAQPSQGPYWNFNIARDIWLDPSSTSASASGYVLDGYGGFHPWWTAAAAKPVELAIYPYYFGDDIARSMWFLPTATPAAATGYQLDGFGGIHPFASGGQTLPPDVRQNSYWPGRDIAKTLFGA